jgi:hypothetical protein
LKNTPKLFLGCGFPILCVRSSCRYRTS